MLLGPYHRQSWCYQAKDLNAIYWLVFYWLMCVPYLVELLTKHCPIQLPQNKSSVSQYVLCAIIPTVPNWLLCLWSLTLVVLYHQFWCFVRLLISLVRFDWIELNSLNEILASSKKNEMKKWRQEAMVAAVVTQKWVVLLPNVWWFVMIAHTFASEQTETTHHRCISMWQDMICKSNKGRSSDNIIVASLLDWLLYVVPAIICRFALCCACLACGLSRLLLRPNDANWPNDRSVVTWWEKRCKLGIKVN